jgi:hypothetical protein
LLPKEHPPFGLDRNASEAIAFFLLHALVNGTVVGDFFMSSNQSVTLPHLLETAASILKKFDGELYETVLFAFSWIPVLLSQIYKVAQILRLWDFLFGDINCMEQNLAFLITAHLVNLRRRLIDMDFVHIMNEFKRLELDSEAEVEAVCTTWKFVRTHHM